MKEQDWINNKKIDGIYRILFMNLYGLSHDYDEKIAQLQRECE